MSVVSQTHMCCSTARNKGTCDNRRSIKREALEELVLSGLQNHLMDPSLCDVFAKEYVRHINKIRIAKHASIETFKADLARIDREHAKLVHAICDGVPETKVKDRMISLEAQQRELEDKLVNCKDDPVLFHPNMSAVYRQQVSHLAKALNDLNGCTEAAEILRSLIDRITITSDSRTGLLAVDLEGGLAGNLSLSQTNKKMSPPLLKTTFRN